MGTINTLTLTENPVYNNLELVHATPSASFVAMANKVGLKWAKTHGGELPTGVTGPYGNYFDYVRSHFANDVRTTGNDLRFAQNHPTIIHAIERDFQDRLEVPKLPISPPTVLSTTLTIPSMMPTPSTYGYVPPTSPTCVVVPPKPSCGAVPEPSSCVDLVLGISLVVAGAGLLRRILPSKRRLVAL